MAHLLAPQPPNQSLPVIFNVDGVVGAAPAQNLREDVLLVQFAFKLGALNPMGVGPEMLNALRAVQVTGSIDAATINAIRFTQQSLKKNNPGQIVDGRVSPAKGAYSFGPAIWTIVFLNKAIQARHKEIWPRLDKIEACPSELQDMVIRTLVGT
jgi:hypothetical protein